MGPARDPGEHDRARILRSEITGELFDEERSATWLRGNTPLPQPGTPGDFTGAILWLASDAGRHVTGQTIRIDGGWTAR